MPNEHKICQMVKNIPNVRKILTMAIKYVNIFQSKALPNLPKLFLINHLATLASTSVLPKIIDVRKSRRGLARKCLRSCDTIFALPDFLHLERDFDLGCQILHVTMYQKYTK
jgi:hypothetical protein